MHEAVASVFTAVAIVVGGWAAILAIGNRLLSNALFYVAAALEIGLLVQLVGGFIALATTERSVDGVTFSGYLLTVALVLPIGVAWGASDKSRWGTGVVAIAAWVVIVLVWRLVQIWNGVG